MVHVGLHWHLLQDWTCNTMEPGTAGLLLLQLRNMCLCQTLYWTCRPVRYGSGPRGGPGIRITKDLPQWPPMPPSWCRNAALPCSLSEETEVNGAGPCTSTCSQLSFPLASTASSWHLHLPILCRAIISSSFYGLTCEPCLFNNCPVPFQDIRYLGIP